jgi:hypothetical protein
MAFKRLAALLLAVGTASAAPLPGRKTEKALPAGKSAADHLTGSDFNRVLDRLDGTEPIDAAKVKATGTTTARPLAERFADRLDMKDRGVPGPISRTPNEVLPGVTKFEDLTWPDNITLHFIGPVGERTIYSNHLAPDQSFVLPGGTYVGPVPVNEPAVFSSPYHTGVKLDVKTPASFNGVPQSAHVAAAAMLALGQEESTVEDRSLLFSRDGLDQWQLVAHGDASLELHHLKPSVGDARYARLHFDKATGDLGIQRSFASYPLDVGSAIRIVHKPSTDAIDGNRHDNYSRFAAPTLVLEESTGKILRVRSSGGYGEFISEDPDGGVSVGGYKSVGNVFHAVSLDAFYPRLAPNADGTIKLGDTTRRWSTGYFNAVSTTNLTATGNVIAGAAYPTLIAPDVVTGSPANGGSVTPNAVGGTTFVYTAGAGVASFTVASPTNPTNGQQITILVKNASGGALAVAWGASFQMAAWTNPGDGKSRAISFVYESGAWREVSRTPTDVLRATTTIDLASVAANACSHTDVALVGAVVGAECATSLPAGFPDNAISHCHVDAADNVDLHVCSLGSPYDPPSATYSVRVFNP